MITPEGHAELLEAVSDETARDIIAYRKKIKKPLTARAARSIAKELMKLPADQRDAAVDTWQNKGWQGFFADWIKSDPFPNRVQPQTGGSPKTFDYKPSGEKVLHLPKRKTVFQEAWDRGEFKKAGE